jgi:hypothetical protein
MTPPLGPLLRASIALAIVVSFFMGVVAVGCGPEKRYCPDSATGTCPIPVEAGPPPSDARDAPEEEMGSIFVPQG